MLNREDEYLEDLITIVPSPLSPMTLSLQKPSVEAFFNLTANKCLNPLDATERTDFSFDKFVKLFVIFGMNRCPSITDWNARNS